VPVTYSDTKKNLYVLVISSIEETINNRPLSLDF